MKTYTKTIDGKYVVKPRNKIIVYKNNQQIINPTHDMLLEDGWTEYIISEPTEEELFKELKENKIQEILNYDSSSEVNEFYIQTYRLWLDKATRVGLKLRFDAEMAVGQITTVLWNNGIPFELKLVDAIQMLNAIELYASACYDNTQKHVAAINALTTAEEVEVYNYRTGYPAKLRF